MAVENARPAFPVKVEFPKNSSLTGQRGACRRYRRSIRFSFGGGEYSIAYAFIPKQQNAGNKTECSNRDAY